MTALNDPVADLLTRIRNGCMARKTYVDIEWSKLKENIVRVLKERGYVAHYLVKEQENKGTMRIFLKFSGREPVIQGIKRYSKCSLRKYVSHKKIPKVRRGLGDCIISTSRGVKSGFDAAKEHLGGELLCIVW